MGSDRSPPPSPSLPREGAPRKKGTALAREIVRTVSDPHSLTRMWGVYRIGRLVSVHKRKTDAVAARREDIQRVNWTGLPRCAWVVHKVRVCPGWSPWSP